MCELIPQRSLFLIGVGDRFLVEMEMEGCDRFLVQIESKSAIAQPLIRRLNNLIADDLFD
ncbi:hypothetical protein [Nostoc sp.]|uniref:hypothetical protein n=1 Tax=Nostoc sp. TaxID=1180 RepID=UPI002FF9DAB1